MKSAGLIHDMVNVTGSNRTLLRGDQSIKFRNFDLEAYLEGSAHYRVATYREASPIYLQQLREQLLHDNARTSRLRTFSLAFSIGMGIFLFYCLQWALA